MRIARQHASSKSTFDDYRAANALMETRSGIFGDNRCSPYRRRNVVGPSKHTCDRSRSGAAGDRFTRPGRLDIDADRALRWAFSQAVLAVLWPTEPGLGADLSIPFGAMVGAALQVLG